MLSRLIPYRTYSTTFAAVSQISHFSRLGQIRLALKIFDDLQDKTVTSWNAIMSGYFKKKGPREARKLFDKMPETNTISWNGLVSGYVQNGMIFEARKVFDQMPERNVVSWTAMIRGYVQEGLIEEAELLFWRMPERNVVSWTVMSGRINEAAELFKEMPVKPVAACNEMIMGFGLDGEVGKTKLVFDQMREKDDGTWSTMIKIYERKGFELEALALFSLMQTEGVRPSFPSVISVLSVCGSLASLDHGRQVHSQLVRSQFDIDIYVSSVLITMYIKCGDLVTAKRVFDRFSSRDIVMWNSIIAGYAQHGFGEKALEVFHDMFSSSIAPDENTFIGVLSAWKLNEAMNLIENMPVEADATVWGALLGACRTHRNLDLAEIAAKKLLQLEPNNAGPSILLSNLYASQSRWKDVVELRKIMRARNLRKSPGCSWIEVDKKVHIFSGGGSTSHPEHEMILKKLGKLGALLREAGYCPDGSFVMHDVDEEEKVHSLRDHSEKLAVAYGLLKVPEGMPIRVMKNLRVCGDCHLTIKVIAQVTGR
ncbi:hypothetical protein POTOM_020308 [Populus tomentosa]|uniref:DYW domain-containing protein n=1 Tax=Populus tomentosa TaxID=118781 RepID=A0A8X7ZNE7_POPTO|nr:hypothetical protein POTOM_020308 [Populus tomentosa]